MIIIHHLRASNLDVETIATRPIKRSKSFRVLSQDSSFNDKIRANEEGKHGSS
jgi:hypothetical protein